jgi:dTDP-4-amino-4,6-dideoxygalactose transaminase
MEDAIPFADLGAMTREVRADLDLAWGRTLDAGDFVRGDAVTEFEIAWAAYCHASFALGVANGTDALQLALRALDLVPGDEVVLPANTFVATAEAVVLAGLTPRFADVDPDTLLLSAETLEAAITPRTKVVIVVHLFGQVPDMDAIGGVAERAGLVVIEDAAQAHGATWRGRRAGSFGTMACFSFYPGKNLGAFGDGGAIVTSDPGLAERVDMLRDHGRVRGGRHSHGVLGTNSRLDTLQAAILSIKLARLDAWTAARQRAAAVYRAGLAGSPALTVGLHPDAGHVYHLAVVRVPDRDRVMTALREQGIGTGIHYPTPCHLLEPLRRYADRPLPAAEAAAQEILSLPMFPHLTEEQAERVCTVLRAVTAEGLVAGRA